MRIVHTADWHVGRIWKGVNRLDETGRALDHLTGYLERERIDLLLVAGDVFDTPNPGADAEQLVFEFFRRLKARQIPAVVIAGNHDHPRRLDAYGQLTDLAGVHVVGRPRPANKGGVIEIGTRAGETALVAALPFAGPGVFASGLELAADDTQARSQYAERFKQAVAHLASAFRPECVNLLMAHTHFDGAVFANSERLVHLGEDWAAAPQALPHTAQYVALGHIHKPQRLPAAPAPAEYAGSPLQLDFGEVGQAKSFVVVEATASRPARIERVAYEGGMPLFDLRLTMPELEASVEQYRDAGWLRVTVLLETLHPDLGRKVRERLPRAVSVKYELPSVAEAPVACRDGKRPLELYREYYCQRVNHQPPGPPLEAAFQQLYDECARDCGD
jgi:exonuclease SbcD